MSFETILKGFARPEDMLSVFPSYKCCRASMSFPKIIETLIFTAEQIEFDGSDNYGSF